MEESSHPFFTVIVPVYNQAQFLGAALESLIAQTDSDWEAVVVNDGSTDTTRDVMEDYERNDSRFRCFHKPNGGVASALNMGLQAARGRWVCWLSSDDMFMPRKLEIHRNWIARYSEDKFFFTYFRLLRQETGEITDHELWGPLPEREFQLTSLFYRNYISGITICIHREAWLQIGNFDKSLRYGQDYDMWLRLLATYPGRFIPEWTVVSRNHALQGSEVFPQACYYDTAKAIIRFLNIRHFDELFPLLNLNDAKSAVRAVEKTLDVLTQPSGFIYSLGPHPALLFRLLEWFGGRIAQTDPILTKRLHKIISKRMIRFSKRQGFSLQAKAAFAAIQNPKFSMQYTSQPSSLIGEGYYYSHIIPVADILPLNQYLKTYENLQVRERAEESGGDELVILLPPEVELPGGLETANNVAEVSRFFSQRGYIVLLAGLSKQSLGVWNGYLFLGAGDVPALRSILSKLGRVDVLLSLTGAKALKWVKASRKVEYFLPAGVAEDMPSILYEKIKAAPIQVDYLDVVSGCFSLLGRAISKRVSRLARMFIP